MAIDWEVVGWIAGPTATLLAVWLAWALRRLSDHRAAERKRRERLRPLVNHLTVRLAEISEVLDRLESNEWEQALGGYEAIPPPEGLEELADEAAAVSAGASFNARKLVAALEEFRQLVDDIRWVGRRRAREIQERIDSPRAGDEEYGRFEYLAMNQEYHAWRNHRDDVADKLFQLSRELEPFAAEDTLRQLTALRGQATSEDHEEENGFWPKLKRWIPRGSN